MSLIKTLLGVILLIMLVDGGLFLFARREKAISGTVSDCATNQPVAGAEVSVNQRGWGFSKNGSLVWDKDYVSKTITNSLGEFTLTYKVGSSAKIKAKKEGYITAEQFESPGQGIVIRMLQGDKLIEVTYNCRLSSECLQTIVEDGVYIIKNICEK